MIGGYVTLALVLLAAGLVVSVAAAGLMAFSLLRPPRMTDGKALYLLRRLSPADLGLAFEDVAFAVRDEPGGRTIRIAGWWIPANNAPPADNSRCVVLLHGYADAKIGAVAWAPVWHALGYHVLAIDLRAHGQSGGRVSTAGHRERHDVSQVIDQIRAERPGETARLVLFGVSLGAAVAAATAAARAELNDLSAVVLDSPFADFRHAASYHMDRLGMPGGLIRRVALAWAERWAGADFAAHRPVTLIPQIPCPLLVITAADDPFVSPPDAAALERAAGEPPSGSLRFFWRAAGATHGMIAAADSAEYSRRLETFLADAVPPAAAAGSAADRGIS